MKKDLIDLLLIHNYCYFLKLAVILSAVLDTEATKRQQSRLLMVNISYAQTAVL